MLQVFDIHLLNFMQFEFWALNSSVFAVVHCHYILQTPCLPECRVTVRLKQPWKI